MNVFGLLYWSILSIHLAILLLSGILRQPILFTASIISCVAVVVLLNRLRQRWLELTHAVEDAQGQVRQVKEIREKLDEVNIVLAEKTAAMNIHNRIMQAMTSSMDVTRVLRVILEAVVDILRHDRAVLFLLDDKSHVLEAKQAVGLRAGKIAGLCIPLRPDLQPFNQAVREARPLIVTEAKQYRESFRLLNDEKRGFPDEIVVVPLVAKDAVIGLLLVDNLATRRKFQEEDLRNLLSYTQQAGMAVLNARLYETEKNFHVVLKKEVAKARKELMDAQALVIQSERLAALGEMAAVVAHEVKNPMSSIRACAQSIEYGLKKGGKIETKYIGYIHKEIDRLDKIVRSILAYARPPAPRMIPYDINILIDETLDLMIEEIRNRKVKIEKIIDVDIPRAVIDPEQTKQVLINLIDNALFFLAKRETRIITVRTGMSDSRVMFSVSDTGGGIKESIVEKIFEPFFTTRSQGTGLGLAICQKIIESQHGQIVVHNSPGDGVRMDIMLPAVGTK